MKGLIMLKKKCKAKDVPFIFTFSIIMLALLLFPSEKASAWTVSYDMETSATSINSSMLSSDYVHGGSKSFKIPIAAGDESVGIWSFRLGGDLHEGDELWARVYLYAPAGFDWTANPITKLLRIAPATSTGSSWAYHSILATRPANYGCGSGSYGYMVTGSENNSSKSPPPICQNRNTSDGGAYLTPGKWHSIELYLKISATNGMIRAWQNGVLRNEYAYPTIPAGGYIPQARTTDWTEHHLLGWWNGGATKNQNIYFDDLVVTNERPANKDANGNYMIGSASGPSIPAPVVTVSQIIK